AFVDDCCKGSPWMIELVDVDISECPYCSTVSEKPNEIQNLFFKGSVPEEPSRSVPKEPSRLVPEEPTRSVPKEPSRSVPKEPS
nr:hypothetical protein [Tanacetum cinerariifolium]